MKKITAFILALIMITAVSPLNTSAFEPDRVVENIEITLDSRIAGKTPVDCAEFLTVSGEGIAFDNSTFKATYTDGHFNNVLEAEVFEEGKQYTSVLYLYPAEGYILPYYTENISISYNIIKSTDTVEGGYYLSAEEHTDGNRAGYYKVTIHYYAEPQIPDGIEKITYDIGIFFEKVSVFFTQTFIQPIADFIMEILNMFA